MPYNKKDHIQKKLASIYGIQDIERFINPTEQELRDPYLLKNIEKAGKRIIQAIHKDEKISIFADVDSDGCTSTAIMYNYLRNLSNNVIVFHAQRSDGHGIETAKDDVPSGTNLLIILDSSTNSVEACQEIKEKNIDIIVLDHHEQSKVNPYCILVNPQQNGCEYPNKNISGAVVALKMIQVLDDELEEELSNQFIDLAAIGLLGDQMNMLEYENRYIVKQGLSQIRNRGIKSLLEEFNLDRDNLSSTNILYSIVPAINACCRLDTIQLALELLTEENPKESKELAKEISKLNDKRKTVQSQYYNQLMEEIDEQNKAFIIINNEIGAGYRGLIAGDLANKYKRPAMILCESENGTLKGSYRSVDYNLKSLLNQIPEIIYAEGHKEAGGVSFHKNDLDIVQNYLNKHLPDLDKGQYIEYILEFNLEDIDEPLIRNVEEFYRISGNKFESGLFKVNNVFLLDKQVLGKEKNTLKLPCCSSTFIKAKTNYQFLDPSHALMKFRTNEEYISDKYINKEIELVGTLNLNIYKNPRTKKTTKTNQIFIEDYRLVY